MIETLKERWFEHVLLATLVVMMLGMAILVGDMLFAKPSQGSAEVVGVDYAPARSSVGVGSAVKPNASGGSSVSSVVVVSSESEKFTVLIRLEDGRIKSATTDAETYFALVVGQRVEYTRFTGRLTGNVWGYEVP